MSSIQPRKQRKALYNAPLHVRRKQVASHLSEELLLKYNRRSVPVITGDEVKILRGGSKGKSGKVVSVDTSTRKVVVEGVTHKKADGTDIPLAVDPSNLLVVRLNLEDQRRRDKLGADEADKAEAKAAKASAKADKAEAKTSAKAEKATKATKAEPAAAPPKAQAAEAAAGSEPESAPQTAPEPETASDAEPESKPASKEDAE